MVHREDAAEMAAFSFRFGARLAFYRSGVMRSRPEARCLIVDSAT